MVSCPFAPAVRADAAAGIFELPPGGVRLGRFMSGVFPVRPDWRGRLAAVTHVDGTARVQVVDAENLPRYHAEDTARPRQPPLAKRIQ